MVIVADWPRGIHRRPRRHPAEVTSDRLGNHIEKWFHTTDGALRDEISHVRDWLERIAEGEGS